MKTYDLFIRTLSNGRHKAYTLEMLQEYDATLCSKDAITDFFGQGGGQWCSIHCVDPWLGEHHDRLEAKLWEKEPDTRGRWQNRSRWNACLIEIAVQSWDLNLVNPNWTPNEEGCKWIENEVRAVVYAILANHCYAETADDAFFTKNSTSP